jgi:folate-dependent phosphoribosylglycinamide formyltransferase PurN
MYNGHPGLNTRYPELKGKDPQKKAWDLNLDTSGCVIHQVTAGVDEGPIARVKEIPIRNLSLEELYTDLHELSVDLWCKFLRRHWL